MKTTYGLFDDVKSSRLAAEALEKAGFSRNNVKVLTKADKAEVAALKKSGRGSDVDYYLDCVEKDDCALMVVDSDDARVNKATEILGKHGMMDLEKSAKSHARPDIKTDVKAEVVPEHGDADHVMHVVQESLQIDKREVERGRVRVYNRVTEKEVEEKIGLRDETIHVERREVNRPVEATSFDDLFKERFFEIRHVGEEPIVSKVARVVGEVVVKKAVNERVHVVKDRVRRADVEVEQLQGARAFDERSPEFREYFDKYLIKSGHSYEAYLPAFRFGHYLALDENTLKRSWSELEEGAQKTWEQKNPGTWSIYKAAVRHAFDRARA
jgi:uncharacterized protein (TIGR02271 family)